MMAPIVEAVLKERNIEVEKPGADQYVAHDVTGIPTFILVDEENKEVRRLVGAVPKPRFEKFLEE
jgi:thioredoxin-related protein